MCIKLVFVSVTFMVTIAVGILVPVQAIHPNELILVGPGSTIHQSQESSQPYSFYAVDFQSQKLATKLDLIFTEDRCFNGIQLKNDIGIAIIYIGLVETEKVLFVSMSDITVVDSISAAPENAITGVTFDTTSGVVNAVAMQQSLSPDGNLVSSVAGRKSLGLLAVSKKPTHSFITGLASSSGISEVLYAKINADGSVTGRSDRFPRNVNKVQLKQLSSLAEKEWILIVATEESRCILELVRSDDRQFRTLLIEDKKESRWSSIEIPGTETKPRFFGSWLIGTIADKNPQTSYSNRLTVQPPKFREEVTVVDLQKANQFSVTIGPDCEVLWVDRDSTVYYRVMDSLFQAKIVSNDFNDAKLILTDKRLHHIHLAFRKE